MKVNFDERPQHDQSLLPTFRDEGGRVSTVSIRPIIRVRWLSVMVAVVGSISCSSDGGQAPAPAGFGVSAVEASDTLVSSPKAAARIDSLRTRFLVTQKRVPGSPPGFSESLPVFAPGVAERFVASSGGRVRAVVSLTSKNRVARSASVELPAHANGEVVVEDDTSHLAVRFALEGADKAPIEIADGTALYSRALVGADLVHRVHAEGTEDLVAFESKPAREELVYRVDVTRAAGLRLVSNTLEFLDAGGAPRLRVAPPWVVDAHGDRHEATLQVKGCAYDTDSSGPWGRAPTKPGAARCGVCVVWSTVEYPAVVDPNWVATGSMASQRTGHSATLLSSGRVLIAGGGAASVILSTAELFDLGVFAATGSMASFRAGHASTLLASGKVLVAGGINATSTTSTAELFTGSSFVPAGPMTTPRQDTPATLLADNRVLVAAGYSGSAYLSTAELYDESSNTFVATGSLTGVRGRHTATRLPSGKVLIAGGFNSSSAALSTTAMFDGTSSFATVGSMLQPRREHTATLLPSGKVLVAGGFNGSWLSSAELFDGTTTFAATGSLSGARHIHLATLLPGGQVLITGGVLGTSFYSTSELFDGVGAFTTTAAMATARGNHTATLLQSNKVLVAGGILSFSTTVSSAEIFTGAVGAACASAGDCLSGFCTDGRCCNRACAGTCEACDVSGALGTCTNVTGAVHGSRTACAGTGACIGACVGSGPACIFPLTTTCAAATCSDATHAVAEAKCTATGACVAPTPMNCAPGTCSAGACTAPDAGVDAGADAEAGSDSGSTDSGSTDSGKTDSGKTDSGTTADTQVDGDSSWTDSGLDSAVDSSDAAEPDVGEDTIASDAGSDAGDASGDAATTPRPDPACGCRVPSREDRTPMPAVLLALGAVVCATRRRARSAPR